ncbi:UNVERIFIED_CONTAM: Transcription factor [Sesamum radiatum]|uniref:Transcription factor n=1 Tax=Sesamum radiatum TaxID=300843 RepID=A0AAW2RDJ8_SESRA
MMTPYQDQSLSADHHIYWSGFKTFPQIHGVLCYIAAVNTTNQSLESVLARTKPVAFIPQLPRQKMDKILGDTVKCLEYLQQRVELLEEHAANQGTESVVVVKKSQITADAEGCSDRNNGNSDEQRLPEIEARVCNNSIRLKIQCEKVKGVIVKILDEVERLNLVVVNASVVPFGSFALHVSIIAEMEKEFSFSTNDVVTALRCALQATA